MTIARDLSKILDANGDLNIDANTLFVDSSTNRVGIGTSSPLRVLDIATTTGGTIIHMTDDATGHLATDGVDIQQEGTLLQILNREAGDIRLGTNNTERMRIDSSGNVLVGTTTTARTTDDGITLAPDNIAVSKTSDPALEVMRRSTNGDAIKIRRDSTTAGTIRVLGGDILDVNGTSILTNSIGSTVVTVLESTTLRQDVDNSIDLGKTTHRWKDLYLGGNIYLGGTGSANALDDYEEGTFTPTLSGTTTGSTLYGWYIKIGSLVCVRVDIYSGSFSSSSGVAKITNLPFTVNTSFGSAGVLGYNNSTTNASNSGFFDQNKTEFIFYDSGTINTSTFSNGTGKFFIMTGTYKTN